jgi:hypothetical protein
MNEGIFMANETIIIDLQAAAEGFGVINNPNLQLSWKENIQGYAALNVMPLKKEFDVEDKWILMFDPVEFEQAIVEFDALGQSEPPQSNFLGIAFHATDDVTHEAIYFRPFNFQAEDPVRKIHAVQYVSHPEYPWFDLRRDMNEQYEKPIVQAPDGNSWFHVKIEINRPSMKVFVNGSESASLEVNELVFRPETGFGLWCGPGVGGYFANMKVIVIK